MHNSKGSLLVLSGPSGVGKGTAVEALTALGHDFFLSISATTRLPRPGEEREGRYIFLDTPQFEERIARGTLLEYARYLDHYYGTPAEPVWEQMARGRDVLLEIDAQGAFQVKRAMPEAVTVFLMPPSMEELERRLRRRGTEDESAIARRLSKAAEEMQLFDRFDYTIVNTQSDQTARLLRAVLLARRWENAREE